MLIQERTIKKESVVEMCIRDRIHDEQVTGLNKYIAGFQVL